MWMMSSAPNHFEAQFKWYCSNFSTYTASLFLFVLLSFCLFNPMSLSKQTFIKRVFKSWPFNEHIWCLWRDNLWAGHLSNSGIQSIAFRRLQNQLWQGSFRVNPWWRRIAKTNLNTRGRSRRGQLTLTLITIIILRAYWNIISL